MIVSSNAPPTLSSTENFIAQLQDLTNQLERAIQELKSHLEESLPGNSEIERLLINLRGRQATRTNQLLSNVPHSADGLLTAVNLVQTYLQVTEFLSQAFCDDIQRVLGSEQGNTATQRYVQTYLDARQALDEELVDILRTLKTSSSVPPITTPETQNPRIDDLLKESNEILKVLDSSEISIDEKATKLIQYLEKVAEPILKSDGFELTEAQISLLIGTWSSAMEKLSSAVSATVLSTEVERKQRVTQFLQIRRLLENVYDLLAEILRFKDPLGFRAP